MDRLAQAQELLNGYRPHQNIEVAQHNTYCPGVDVFDKRQPQYVSQVIVADDGYYVAVNPSQSEQAQATTRVIARRLSSKLGENWEISTIEH